ncbi:hypothetical protein EV421DRAFT_1909312 [Armillaria borealis]|uniref:Uncharacterized protein n=1 Tax=Armillaria borealis TaxID=47425 RepID=A0AA39J4Y3_9AGAR|nr:hypothetical protein EV421DRAFT_1909312 [Armillaria borealis]
MPALRVKRYPRPAASDVLAVTLFAQECPTGHRAKPSMKSEESRDGGDVFGRKWYGVGRVLSSSVRAFVADKLPE